MKNLFSFICTTVFVLFAFQHGIAQRKDSGTSARSVTSTSHSTQTNGNQPISRTTKSFQKPANQQPASRPKTNVHKTTSDYTHAKPSPIAANKEQQTSASSYSAASTAGDNQNVNTAASMKHKKYVNTPKADAELYMNFWKENRVFHARKARRVRRRCGCGGDVTVVNTTSDTLEFYFAYLKPSEVPTIPNQAIPSIRNYSLYASFYVAPNDSATFKGYCMGGLQYEAVTKHNLHFKENYRTPHFETRGTFRMNCVKQTIVVSEENNQFR